MGTLAAARRADTAYDRFLAATNPMDVAVQGSSDLPYGAMAALPEVEESAPVAFVVLYEQDWSSRPSQEQLNPLVAPDDVLFDELNTARMLVGRAPVGPDEIAITPLVAESRGLDVGDHLTLQAATPEQLPEIFGGRGGTFKLGGPTLELTVVGIGVAPTEFLRSGNGYTVHLAPAFLEEHGARVATVAGMGFRLRGGARDVPSFKAGVERLLGGATPGYITQSEDAEGVRDSIHLQAVALRSFAAAAAVVALVTVGQALTREAAAEGVDDRTLAALGMTPPQLAASGVARAAVIGVVGAALSTAVAVALSPLLLFGLVEQAETNPGVWVDERILVVGALFVVVATVVLSMASAWVRLARSASPLRRWVVWRPSRLASAAMSSGAPAPVAAGVRMALEPGGGTERVPVRAALVAATASVASVVLALSFVASLNHLFASPPLYGWNWDALYGNPYADDVSDLVTPILRESPEVGAFSTVSFAQVDVEGVRTQILAFDPVQGSLLPPLVEGRMPERPDEVAVGGITLRDVDAQLGDVVTLGTGSGQLQATIVGRVVLPSLGQYDVEGLGQGALLTQAGLARLSDARRNLFAVSFAAGVDREAAAAALREQLGLELHSLGAPPEEVADFGSVDALPVILAGMLAVVGAATLAHVVLYGVRRRRRELAVLKTLGFVRRDVSATVAWQATTLGVLALGLGLPVGVAAGRVTWQAFATGLGVVSEPVVPMVALAVVVPAALVVANAVAIVPGRLAARTAPAQALRAD